MKEVHDDQRDMDRSRDCSVAAVCQPGRLVADDGQYPREGRRRRRATLPGVTVVVTGATLGTTQRNTVTSESGGFQIAVMPIGTYTVSADLAGFQKQAAGNVRVAIGKVTSVDFTMPEAFSDEITVTRRDADHRRRESDLRRQIRFEQIIDLPTRGISTT